MKEYIDRKTGIYLRLMTYEDTENIVNWRNSEPVRRNFIYQALFTRESHENWIKTMIDTGKVVQMMICEMETDRAVGSVYIRDIDYNHQKAEYGIFIGEDDARGKGYGSAAAELMLRYCFEELKLHRVYLRVYATNIQAIRSYEKAGFIKEAHLRDEVCIDGKFHDIVLMGILNN